MGLTMHLMSTMEYHKPCNIIPHNCNDSPKYALLMSEEIAINITDKHNLLMLEKP